MCELYQAVPAFGLNTRPLKKKLTRSEERDITKRWSAVEICLTVTFEQRFQVITSEKISDTFYPLLVFV